MREYIPRSRAKHPSSRLSVADVSLSMIVFTRTANKYLSSKGGFFETQTREQFNHAHDLLKSQIHRLSAGTDDKEYFTKAARKFERKRANCWAKTLSFAPSSSTKGESSKTNPQVDQKKKSGRQKPQGSKPGGSGNNAKEESAPHVPREAREALEKYIGVCREEIRTKCDDSWWMSSDHGLEIIDEGYKETREMVKKAVEAANDTNVGKSQNVDKRGEEELLKNLRGIWRDARRIFADAWDEDVWDSDLDEERKM